MKRKVQWPHDALRDLKAQIRIYCSKKSYRCSSRDGGHSRTVRELGFMSIGRPGRADGTFEKPVHGLPLIIAYTITSVSNVETITILRVIHSAREWPDEEWMKD